MATAELALRYRERGVGGWEATSDEYESQDAGLETLRADQFGSDEIGPEFSYAIERLYDARKGRAHSDALVERSMFDLAFAAVPTVAFSFSALGLIAAMLAIAEKSPAFFIPGILAALGFVIVGSVAWYLATLMWKATH